MCPTELLAFRYCNNVSYDSERAEDFKKIGADVVGISVDNEYAHLAWT